MNSIAQVLGRRPATPMEFYIVVRDGEYLQLDDVVFCHDEVPGRGRVSFYGIVESVEKLHEGLTFDSDVELVEQGILPSQTAYVGKVMVTRVEPELFVPPQPGTAVFRATGADLDMALYFDGMKHKLAAGLMRNGETAYLNYDFLCGEKGAHINISGISGVATKTSYALFLLHSLFNSQIGQEVANSHALVFNVKGEDLLYLDLPNRSVRPEDREAYQRLGLPCEPFQSVAFYAPPRDESTMIPDVVRMDGVSSFVWTLREFADQGLFKFLFAEAGHGLSQLEFAVERITHVLRKEAKSSPPGELVVKGVTIRSLEQLSEMIAESLDNGGPDEWFGTAAAGTKQALVRRLQASIRYIQPLVRDRVDQPHKHQLSFESRQVTVVDIHRLHTRAKSFVVGAVLSTLFEQKERSSTPEPRIYVVLDELNKYAPATGWNPIKDILLDVAERGRSMGIVLIGAQQTASEIEDRIVSNAAFRVAGRLDAAESQKASYGWMSGSFRMRAAIMKPGSMLVHQPELPSPLMVQFPFPAWATRSQEVDRSATAKATEAVLQSLLGI